MLLLKDLHVVIAHNAFASKRYGYWYRQQNLTITQQFELGCRGFMIDVHPHKGRAVCAHCPRGKLWIDRICHMPCAHRRSFSEILSEIVNNAKIHGDIVLVFLENYCDETFDNFLEPFKNDLITPADGDLSALDLNEMKAQNRFVILLDDTQERLHAFKESDYVIHNSYGSIRPQNVIPEPSIDITKFYHLNLFPEVSLRRYSFPLFCFGIPYKKVNSVFLGELIAAAKLKWPYINGLTVDFVEDMGNVNTMLDLIL